MSLTEWAETEPGGKTRGNLKEKQENKKHTHNPPRRTPKRWYNRQVRANGSGLLLLMADGLIGFVNYRISSRVNPLVTLMHDDDDVA